MGSLCRCQRNGNELVLHLEKKFKLSPFAGKVMLVAFLRFTWNNTAHIICKRPNCDC